MYKFPLTFITGAKVWYVECETIVLNPDQSNELFQSTENVPSVLIWPPSSPEGILEKLTNGILSKFHPGQKQKV